MKRMKSVSALSAVSISVGSYAVAELIHHGVLTAYLMPWLLDMGMSVVMAQYIVYAMIGLSVAAIGYMVYKFFFVEEI